MNLLNSIKEKITQYVQLKFELFRLETIERAGNVMGYFVFIILSFFLTFAMVILVGIGVAEWFSALFGNRTGGYFAAAGLFLVILAIFMMVGKYVARFFADKAVWLLSKPKKEHNDDMDITEPKN